MTTCRHCGKSPSDRLRTGLIIRAARKANGLSQLSLLDKAVEHATVVRDEMLAEKLLRRDAQWLSRLENEAKGPPPFGELEALCAVLGLDPAETAKGNGP